MPITRLYNHTSIIVMLFGETATQHLPPNSRNCKTAQLPRILTFSSYDANADPLLDKLSWRKLADRRHSHIATMVYKSLNNLAPDYLRATFVNRDNVTSYTLRDTTNKLAVPKPHTDYLRKSFSYSGATLWNSLPKELRQAKSLEILKSGCKNFFSSWTRHSWKAGVL